MIVNAFGHSDVGRVRAHNEDAWVIDPLINLYLVADGMGGHAAGELASMMAVQSVQRRIAAKQTQLSWGLSPSPSEEEALMNQLLSSPSSEEPSDLFTRILGEAIQQASAEIFETAHQNPLLSGMGTTIVGLWIQHKQAMIGHVGDSRIYLLRDQHIAQITEDHSWVNEQIKLGTITAEEGRVSRFKNIITRSVGFEPDVLVDTFALELAAGDCFLLCSDGLSNLVQNREIGEVMSTTPLSEIPKRLIDIANARGGDDNSSAICVYVEEI